LKKQNTEHVECAILEQIERQKIEQQQDIDRQLAARIQEQNHLLEQVERQKIERQQDIDRQLAARIREQNHHYFDQRRQQNERLQEKRNVVVNVVVNVSSATMKKYTSVKCFK